MTMTLQTTNSTHAIPAPGVRHRIAVVSKHVHEQVIDAVLRAVDYDVIFVESTGHAYSDVKRARPELIIACFSNDDYETCQVLSMLSLDADTAGIPVVTYLGTVPDDRGVEPEDANRFRQTLRFAVN
jgi:hypothetical protein